MRNTIIYIGNFPYPSKSGVGNRARQNVLMLKSLGYRVCVIATDGAVRGDCPLQETKKEIDGCDVYFLPTAKNVKQRIFYKQDLKRVKVFIENLDVNKEIAAVFFTGTKFSLFTSGLVKFCKKRDIKTIADSMDWLAIHTHSLLFNIIKRFDIFWEMRVANKRADGVLAISTYLQDYYAKCGKPTILIPPLFERNVGEDTATMPNEKIRLIYAGTPFGPNVVCKKPKALKDRLDRAIEILYQIKTAGVDNFIFDVYGVTEEGYKTAFPRHVKYVDELKDKLVFHGRTEYSLVEEALRKADFTVLIRDENRETKAGFPSKVGESICSGVPVVISNVGDHARYIKNDHNGFLLARDNETAVNELMGVFKLKREDIEKMKENCRQDTQFIYQTYCDEMKKFLQDVNK